MASREPMGLLEDAPTGVHEPLRDGHPHGSEEGEYSSAAQARTDHSVRNQLRNMVLLEPIFRLHLMSAKSGGEGVSFDAVDQRALALLAFDFVSHRMVMGFGAKRDEIVRHIGEQALRMDPELSEHARDRIAEHVLDGLTNGRERHATFRIPYYDLPDERWRKREFRLLEYEARIDGVLRYVLTPEGVTAFLSMLDIDPQLMQQAEELLIAKMIEKGSFEDALYLGRRSKARTIEYTERLGRLLRRYESYPGAVPPDAINETIDHSLDHVSEREEEEGQLLASIQGRQEGGGLEPDQRALLNEVRELLNDCRNRHARLHTNLIEAPERFLNAQSRLFRIRERSRIPDLEPEVITPLLERSIHALSRHGDAFSAAMNLPIIPKLFEPITLTERIQDIRDPQTLAEDDAVLSPSYEALEEAEHFSQDCQARMKAYLFDQLALNGGMKFSALMERARQQGYTLTERRCLAYLVIGAFCPESSGRSIEASQAGVFVSEELSGVELSLRAIRNDASSREESTDSEGHHEC